jgi:hypothetical protein
MNDKLKKALALGAAVVVGGTGVGVYDGAQPNGLTKDLEELQLSYDEVALENAGLLLDVEALKAELLLHSEIIEEAEAEEAMSVLAYLEILDETRDIEDFLVDEFGWDISDDDDIVIGEARDIEVIESDFEDEDYVFRFKYVPVSYEDDDNEYDEMLDIYVRIKDGDVDQIAYVEA